MSESEAGVDVWKSNVTLLMFGACMVQFTESLLVLC
jgi:hypothetical protein